MRISKTDQQLIDQVRQGDTDSFKEIVGRYEPRVAATVISMLGNCSEADDVGQETFIRFFKSLKDFRGDSSIATYLTRIAINLSLNELKRRKRRKLLFSQSTDSIENIIDETEPEDFALKRIVNRAIQQLDPMFRAVLVLRLVVGYSTKETADILKLPEGTVLSRLARAQKKLKSILTPLVGEKING